MRLAAALLLLAAPALAQPAHPPDQAPHPKPNAPAHTPRPSPPHAAPAKPAHGPAKPQAASGNRRPPAKPPAPHPAAPSPPPAPATPEDEKPAEPLKGSVTGLPLPRFAALRSDDVNFRSGPGTRYPIEWVYKRRDLPVEIEREFEVWRLVRDPDGTKGWVHQATLAGRRTAIVTGAERVLRQSADEAGTPVAKLKPGVILRLRGCAAGSDWCEAIAGDYRGWIKRSEIWGTLPNEVIP